VIAPEEKQGNHCGRQEFNNLAGYAAAHDHDGVDLVVKGAQGRFVNRRVLADRDDESALSGFGQGQGHLAQVHVASMAEMLRRNERHQIGFLSFCPDSERAIALGRYPNCSAAAMIRSRLSFETLPAPLKQRETADRDTSARSATS
jgi:hypothetical protein